MLLPARIRGSHGGTEEEKMNLPEEYSGLQVQRGDSRYWWFLCPFHDDHNPSMSVNKSGQWFGHFRCWTCGKNGSPQKFAKLMGAEPTKIRLPKSQKHIKPSGDKARPKPDFAKLLGKYERNFLPCKHEELEEILGITISINSSIGFGLGWCQEQRVYTAPTYNTNWNVTGILRRFSDGKKKFVRGSVKGLFLDKHRYDPNAQVLLPEGLSDCLAGASLGFQVIGRPDARSCANLLCEFLMKYGLKKPIVVCDNDSPGRAGAEHLADKLADKGLSVKVIELPERYKDFREYVTDGATTECVQQLIDNTPATILMKIQRFRMPR
ncbi:MAG: hypothetical protein CEE38_21925 [Planctomycetes bacterium B3_Pla]|nr:MAG: hypothetical protein CEE38_21925 [Planctomycetes bacterium B3_Pla]